MVVQGAGRVPDAVVGGEAGLTALHARIAGRFARPEVRARARRYLGGLLGRVERKNGWQLAEALGEAGPAGRPAPAQRGHLGRRGGAGRPPRLRRRAPRRRRERRAHRRRDRASSRRATKSCGVGTQYAGAVGGTANAQVGVFLAYASAKGTAFVDRALYLPRAWTHDPARRAEAGVPDGVRFATKLTLAKRLLARAFAAGVPARWVAGDAAYGRSHAFRRWLEDRGRAYALSVPLTHAVAPRGPPPDGGQVGRGPARRTRGGPAPPGRACRASGWTPGRACPWRRRPPRAGGAGCSCGAGRSTPTSSPSTSPTGRRARRWRSWCGCAGMRWQVEEGFAQAKGEVGPRPVRGAHLDRLAPLRHPGPARPRLPGRDAPRRQPGRGRREKGGPDPGLIPLTVPEVRRLLLALAERGERRAHRLRWSRWRRAHQARANRCHAARRALERARRPGVPAARPGRARARGADRRRVGPAPAAAAARSGPASAGPATTTAPSSAGSCGSSATAPPGATCPGASASGSAPTSATGCGPTPASGSASSEPCAAPPMRSRPKCCCREANQKRCVPKARDREGRDPRERGLLAGQLAWVTRVGCAWCPALAVRRLRAYGGGGA